jgi:uncharacterized protein YggL (DUF469 family)
MMLSIRPNPNKRRSRRLRKKLRIAEFQQLGFDYSIVWTQFPAINPQDSFIDRFLNEVILERELLLGGGCREGFILGSGESPTVIDQEAVRAWLSAFPGVAQVNIGPLVDAWYEAQ